MSKRFGRNQKRALTAKMQQAQGEASRFEEAYTLNKALSDRQGRQLRSLEHSMDRVARILGDRFYGLPPISQRVQNLRDSMRIPKQRSVLPFMPNEDVAEMLVFAVEELQSISASVQLETMREMIHIYLETPDGRKAYALSRRAWHEMKGDREHMAEHFGRLIGNELAHFIASGER
jgi:hypothetical protein